MENLNDVEFGSDKSGEEAPILVAQRYLNIFRQVHIFNKAKRDEFDNELLALPENITDFFKRMPGGRLLVEHIEKVKTERGIAFVKANREDFDEGAGKVDTPAVASGAGVVQAVAGSVTIDASFADALAQALANAFKQLPQSPISSSAGPSTITADFGNAFDIIAEEIRTSRASLLDVLKETRSITDSVIASQVSISRILEGILATRDRDDTDIADLNNRIIASQASITKLLEGLYTASNKKNAEISEYLNVENRLRRFREEITSDLDISLQKMQELFKLCAQSVQDRKVIVETRPFTGEAQVSEPKSTATVEKVDNQASAVPSVSEKSLQQENVSSQGSISPIVNIAKEKQPISDEYVRPSRNENTSFNTTDSTVEFQEHKKKKKKKKKNRDALTAEDYLRQTPGANPATVAAAATVVAPAAAVATTSLSQPRGQEERAHTNNEQLSAFDGVIRNKAFKHEDNFDNVRLDLPPLDTDDFDDDIEQPVRTPVAPVLHKLEKQDDLSISSSHPNFGHDDYVEPEPQSHDDLDFVLPDIKNESTSIDDISDFSDIGHISNIESTTNSDDDLDFALPDTSFSDAEETEDTHDDTNAMGFENISQPEGKRFEEENAAPEFDDDLDFALPHVPSAVKEETPDMEISPSDTLSEDIDFTLPEGGNFLDERETTQNMSNETSQQNNPYISNHPMFDAVDEEVSTIEATPVHKDTLEHIDATPADETSQEIYDNSSSLDTLIDSFSDHSDTVSNNFTSSGVDNISPSIQQTVSNSQEDIEQISPLDAFMADRNNEEDNITSAQPQDVIQQDTIDAPASDVSFTSEQNDAAPQPEELDASLEETDADISPLDAFMADRNNSTSFEEPSISAPTAPLDVNVANSKNNDEEIPEKHEPNQSRYSAELDKIREALTADNIDISSLDQPIELDDYSDDENVGKDDYDDILSSTSASAPSTNAASASNQSSNVAAPQDASENSDDEDWEWEYVDENGNEIPESSDDEDWEWEYVEDDEDNSNVDDNKK